MGLRPAILVKIFRNLAVGWRGAGMDARIAKPKHYLAAAMVSNGILWSLTFIMLSIKQFMSPQLFLIIHTSSSTISGIVVGFLTSRKSADEHLKVGFTTGLVSSLFYTLINFIFFRTFETSRWVWMGLFFGGIIGGALWKIKTRKLRK